MNELTSGTAGVMNDPLGVLTMLTAALGRAGSVLREFPNVFGNDDNNMWGIRESVRDPGHARRSRATLPYSGDRLGGRHPDEARGANVLDRQLAR